MNRIVITSCSQRKKTDQELLPAIQRYDGPGFRLLRKYMNNSNERLDIYILSAKYGLLSQTTQIPFYDQKLNKSSQKEFIENVLYQAEQIFSSINSNEFFVNLGSLYLRFFNPVIKKISQSNSLVLTAGASGKRLAEMHDWLYRNNSPLLNEQIPKSLEKEVFIKGIRLQTNEEEIRDIVRREIAANGSRDLQNYHSWFVPIDNLKISPKWLISKLSSLPVGNFHSDQARKLLQRLGIKVKRV